MWSQTVFSAKNRNLIPQSQMMDEYHILTSGVENVRPNEVLRELRHHSSRYPGSLMCFIKNCEHGLFVGLIGQNEDILGEEHEFSREAAVGRYSGKGRKIAFNHAYHSDTSVASKIPDLKELRERQSADLLHVLTEAHAGREPVSMEPVMFNAARSVGTDWDRIATEVETGKCRGGFFNADGKLLDRFENIADTVTNAAQKKTVEKMARASGLAQAEAIGRGPAFMTVAKVTIGLAITGWAAWKLIEHDRKRQGSSGDRPRR